VDHNINIRKYIHEASSEALQTEDRKGKIM